MSELCGARFGESDITCAQGLPHGPYHRVDGPKGGYIEWMDGATSEGVDTGSGETIVDMYKRFIS